MAIKRNILLVLACISFFVAIVLYIVFDSTIFLALPVVAIAMPVTIGYTAAYTEKVFWLLLITLPLSTELNLTPSLGLDFPDEPLMMLLTGLFLLKWVYRPSFFPSSALKHPLFLIVLLQLFWILFTCFFSVNPLLSVKYLLAKIWFVIPLVIIPQYCFRYTSSIRAVALCLVIPMLLVVLQCITRHALYGFSFEGIKATLSPFFRNHVVYSAMLVCVLAILWAMRKLTPLASKSAMLINAGLIIGIIALLLSYSRGAWLALAVGSIVGICIHYKKLKHLLLTALGVLILFTGWLSYHNNFLRFVPDFQHTIFHKDFSQHLNATVQLKDVSNAERFYRWTAAINMIEEKPVTGFGPNNFYDNYKAYAIDIFKTWVSNNPDHSSVHNYFLLTALEQGLIGLFLFVMLIVGMLLATEKLYHHFLNKFYRITALTTGMIISMIIVVNALSDLIETDKIGSLFWLSLGTIFFLEERRKEEMQSIA